MLRRTAVVALSALALGACTDATSPGVARPSADIHLLATDPTTFIAFGGPIGIAGVVTQFFVTTYCPGPGQAIVYSVTDAGVVTPFAPTFTGNGACVERYIDISPYQSPYGSRWIYVSQGNQIFRIDPTGTNVTPFATIPEAVTTHSGVHFDRVGAFGKQLLVTTTNGSLYKVSTTGVPTLVANVGDFIENPGIGPAGFGPYAGWAWVAAENTGRVYAISPTGQTQTVFTGAPNPEGLFPISAHPCDFGRSGGAFFMAAYGFNEIRKYPASAFAGLGGKMIMTSEGGQTQLIDWNGVSYTMTAFANSAFQVEGAGFVRC